MNKREKIRRILNVLIILILIILIAGGLIYLYNKFDSPKQAAEKINSLGFLGYLIMVLIIIFEVVIAPIPGEPITIIAGYAFGTTIGFFLSWIGNILGTALVFFLARKYGRPLVEILVNPEKLEHYYEFFRKTGRPLLFLVFMTPFLPADIIGFAAGISKIRFREFILITSIAYLPRLLIMSYFGDTLFKQGLNAYAILIGLLILCFTFLGYLLHKKLEKKAKLNT